jgi:multidrug efflux pump subunit AcrA (membrane-fusion protein)
MHPIMVEELFVKPGDVVKAGEKLARIDQRTTQILIKTQDSGKLNSQNLEDYREIAKQYGLEEKLNSLMVQEALSTNNQDFFADVNDFTAQQDGRIMTLNVAPGRLVNAGEQLYTINTSSNFSLMLQVDEQDISLVKKGAKVIFWIPGEKENRYFATITTIAPVVSYQDSLLERTSYIEVTAEVCDDVSQTFRHGANIEARIATGEESNLTAVPFQAIAQDENNREFVYQLEGGRPVLRYITIEKEQSKFAYVSSGVNTLQPVFINAEEIDPTLRYTIKYQGNCDV